MTLDYETCVALKEAGFPQKTFFWHVQFNNGRWAILNSSDYSEGELDGFKDHCAAPIADEIARELPQSIKDGYGRDLFLTVRHTFDDRWLACYEDFGVTWDGSEIKDEPTGEHETLAGAFAALYLAIHGKGNVCA